MAVVSRVGLPVPTRAIELGSGSHGLYKAILLERGTANDRCTLGLGGLEECHQPLRLLVALDDPSTIMDRPGRSASLGSASGARFVTLSGCPRAGASAVSVVCSGVCPHSGPQSAGEGRGVMHNEIIASRLRFSIDRSGLRSLSSSSASSTHHTFRPDRPRKCSQQVVHRPECIQTAQTRGRLARSGPKASRRARPTQPGSPQLTRLPGRYESSSRREPVAAAASGCFFHIQRRFRGSLSCKFPLNHLYQGANSHGRISF